MTVAVIVDVPGGNEQLYNQLKQPVTAGRASLVLHRSHCRPGPGTKCVSRADGGNTRT